MAPRRSVGACQEETMKTGRSASALPALPVALLGGRWLRAEGPAIAAPAR
jgi:hypothetical protein